MTSRKNISNYSSPVGFGYIVIPHNEDRSKYIKTCLRKERVAVQLDGGGSVITNCYISKESLNRITFPETSNNLGSAVAYIVPQFYDIPIIVGVISKEDETQLLDENSFKHEVHTNDSIVSIIGKGKEGNLFIEVNSEYSSGGNIYVTLKNKENKANLNIKCFGNISIYSEGDVVLKTLKSTSVQSFYINESGEESLNSKLTLNEDSFIIEDKNENKISSNSEGEINIQPKNKCNLFEGSEPLVKGKELKTQLEEMSNRIDKILDALNAGAVASSTIQTYVAALTPILATITDKENFDKINSEKSFTD